MDDIPCYKTLQGVILLLFGAVVEFHRTEKNKEEGQGGGVGREATETPKGRGEGSRFSLLFTPSSIAVSNKRIVLN